MGSQIEIRKVSTRVIPILRRSIIKEKPKRYKIYLPANLNDVWEELHKRKAKVNIYVEIEKEA